MAMVVVFLIAPLAAAASEPLKILMLGDSLTAGYGLEKGKSVPAQLNRALEEAGHSVQIINAGVSGDTSAGGLSRLAWSLADQPQGLILELGANDGLRGLEPAETRKNLDAIISQAKAAGVKVLLAGMLAPPNLGPEYGESYNKVFPGLAEQHDILFYPFFLEGVVSDPALNQADGIHPNEAGVAVIVKNMMPAVQKLIEEIQE